MNQQNNLEDDKQTETLADLELTTGQAEETKAGTGSHATGGGGGAGKVHVHDLL